MNWTGMESSRCPHGISDHHQAPPCDAADPLGLMAWRRRERHEARHELRRTED